MLKSKQRWHCPGEFSLPSLLPVESFLLVCLFVAAPCFRSFSVCWGCVLLPLSIAPAAQGQVMGWGVSREAKTSSSASELMGGRQSPAMPSLCCVSALSQELPSPDCFARQRGKLPRELEEIVKKPQGIVGWMPSWHYLPDRELQRVGVKWSHKRTSRSRVWEMWDGYAHWLLEEASTDHVSMALGDKLIKPAERWNAMARYITLVLVWW